MDVRLLEVFGPQFVVDDVRDLELLTDLLFLSRDHLNVLFAAASYLEQVPNGSKYFKPLLQTRLRDSFTELSRTNSQKQGSEVLAAVQPSRTTTATWSRKGGAGVMAASV